MKQLKREYMLIIMTDSFALQYDLSSISKEEIKEKLEKKGYKFVRVTR